MRLSARGLQTFVWGTAALFIFVGLVQVNSFYAIGSLQPDEATGRTEPFAMHGTLYVTQQQANLAYWAFGLGAGLALLGLCIPVIAKWFGNTKDS